MRYIVSYVKKLGCSMVSSSPWSHTGDPEPGSGRRGSTVAGGDSRWDSMGNPWEIHGKSMGNPWEKRWTNWLVVTGTMEFWLTFHSVGNFIIPTDELIFFRGIETTNQFVFSVGDCLFFSFTVQTAEVCAQNLSLWNRENIWTKVER